MQKTQLNQNKHQKVSPKRVLGALVALVVFFLLLTSVIGLAEKHFAIKARIRELDAEQANLEAKKANLETMTNRLETPDGQEYVLREKYNLVRPGEQMIIVTKQDKVAGPEENQRPRVLRWWDSLLHGLGIKKDDK